MWAWSLNLMVTQPGDDMAEGLVDYRPFRYELSDHDLSGVRWTFNDLDELTGWLRGLLRMRNAGGFRPGGATTGLPSNTGIARCGWSNAAGTCRLDAPHGHDETGALVGAEDLTHPGYVIPQRDVLTLRQATRRLATEIAVAISRADNEAAYVASRKLSGVLAQLSLLEKIGG